MNNLPQTLQEAVLYFADPEKAFETVVNLRWSNGVTCPHCGSKEVGYTCTRKIWKCKNKECHKQFSVKTGTVMEDSPLGLDKWLIAIWMIANCKNGVSSYEIHRAIGITQKSAWFLLSRIRLAMQNGSFEKMSGAVEVDETYVGGKARFMHKAKRAKLGGRGTSGKTIVLGVLDRTTRKVKAKVISSTKREVLTEEVKEVVETGSTVYTDAHSGYDLLTDEQYIHMVIDHAKAYVDGHISTNGIENFWSLLKRALKGTYISVEPFHLFRYLDEQCFRFNYRKANDGERFVFAASSLSGKRLTYKSLIGKEA